ncbi:RDD family protein [Photobacterium aphoticum]|uniref:RDD domain-containing protein n=1 Tax=Photobacterium aphoticum TaxID=754436 RepID=A0A0J1GTS0_9GAMM|nr:RDD family protein [Photobacterium aphoticum]KLV02829.1 hypothetical protein ABT58_01880 [Photobacterium aphoticum]PSU58159.1 RDD family protein [Photobacterium aphoticum]GHA36389.1 hypothetical protein GCM10007086_07020 [Photobacterium aphoticum]
MNMDIRDGRESVGFWHRLAAYLLDLIPIFIIVVTVSPYFQDFYVSMMAYLDGQNSEAERVMFLSERNMRRDMLFVIWVLYSAGMECTPLQGTHGKWLLGIKVEHQYGGRISPLQALKRAVMKIVGAIPLYLGYLWAGYSKEKTAWHDLYANTRVVKR